jgi:hypothetical protein
MANVRNNFFSVKDIMLSLFILKLLACVNNINIVLHDNDFMAI